MGWISNMVTLVVGLGCLVLAVWALIDAATRRTDAFPAIDRQTKTFWLVILGLGVVVQFWFGVVSFFGLPAVVASIVYLVDIRPKLAEATRGPRW